MLQWRRYDHAIACQIWVILHFAVISNGVFREVRVLLWLSCTEADNLMEKRERFVTNLHILSIFFPLAWIWLLLNIPGNFEIMPLMLLEAERFFRRWKERNYRKEICFLNIKPPVALYLETGSWFGLMVSSRGSCLTCYKIRLNRTIYLPVTRIEWKHWKKSGINGQKKQQVFPFEYRPWTKRINYYKSLYPDQSGKDLWSNRYSRLKTPANYTD